MQAYKEIDYEGLANTTMEAEKSFDLLSVSGRSSEASSVVPVQARRTENQKGQ